MSIALQTGSGRCGATASRFTFHPHPHPHPPPSRFISTTTTTIPFMAMLGAPDPPIGGGAKGADSDSGSSSIGKDSDLYPDDVQVEETGDDEAQSEIKGALDSLGSLQDVLPLKKGISAFYSGKSKSYTNLAEASAVSSIKDLAKPESTYGKKRKPMFDSTLGMEKKAGKTSKGIRIRPYKTQSSGTRSTLDSLAAVPGSETNSCDNSNLSSSSSLARLPPLHPLSAKGSSPNTEVASPPSEQSILPNRSLSLSDLQSATGSGASTPSAGASTPSAGASHPSTGASPPSAGASPPSVSASSPSAGASPPSVSASPPSASSPGGNENR